MDLPKEVWLLLVVMDLLGCVWTWILFDWLGWA